MQNSMLINSMPNRLAKGKSPYLLQCAHNPMNWFPWYEEAFEIPSAITSTSSYLLGKLMLT
ncbi:DUF255 domain-containing protein [Paenibacillus planticolens]|uniref:DUF255 domain-containing protein n=1 Tax=Paenibacillus planticolens TaxID=2654976 RepID=UPI0035E3FC79